MNDRVRRGVCRHRVCLLTVVAIRNGAHVCRHALLVDRRPARAEVCIRATLIKCLHDVIVMSVGTLIRVLEREFRRSRAAATTSRLVRRFAPDNSHLIAVRCDPGNMPGCSAASTFGHYYFPQDIVIGEVSL